MELKELREIIKNSNYTDSLNELEVTVDLPQIKESYRLVGFYNIYKFFYEQKTNWSVENLVVYENLFKDSINFFITAIGQLDSFVYSYFNNSISSDNLKNNFNSNVARFLRPSNNIFTASAPVVEFLIDLHSKDSAFFAPAFNYIVGNSVSFNSKNNITPIILAYEFENSDNSEIFNRRESEKKSFRKIKSELSTLGNTFENEVIKFQKQIECDYATYRNKEDDKISKSRKVLSDWLRFKKNNYESFVSSTNIQFQNLFSNTNEEFINLQNQYGELLKLQEPIKYWKDRAKELNEKANKMLVWLGIGFHDEVF